jgi:hypothetical protein
MFRSLICPVITIGLILGFYQVQAQDYPEVDLEFRTSFQIQTQDAKYEVETLKFEDGKEQTQLGFRLDQGNVDVRGELGESFSYRLRFSLDTNLDESGHGDGTQSSLEYFYVEHRLGTDLDLKIGKQFVLQGGREGMINGLDMYRYSIQGERIQDLYEVGLGLIQEFRFRGNEVPQYGVLQVVNQLQGNGESDENLGYNAAWYGVLGAGLLEPTLQVGFFPKKSKRLISFCGDLKCLIPEQLISAGTRLNFTGAYLNLDLIHGSYYGMSLSNQSIERQASTVALEYGVDPKTKPVQSPIPFAKWTYDMISEARLHNAFLDYRNEISAGIEIYPTRDERLKLHALGAYQNWKVNSGAFNQYLLNLGLSAMF